MSRNNSFVLKWGNRTWWSKSYCYISTVVKCIAKCIHVIKNVKLQQRERNKKGSVYP